MHAALLQHIKKYVGFSKEDLDAITGFLKQMQLKKKQNLLTEGSICHHNYFVAKGCLRMFFINEKGIEQTTEFALENWWLSDYTSFEKQQPSGFLHTGG